MIKIENVEVGGLKPALRGMRNPKNSWARSDSGLGCTHRKNWNKEEDGLLLCENCGHTYDDHVICAGHQQYCMGPNDHDLATRLRNAGTDHRKYLRMIVVWLDVTAPLYWWKEADTYKVGTVANSCSTMHKVADKEFTVDDFSYEHLVYDRYKDDFTFCTDDICCKLIASGYFDLPVCSTTDILRNDDYTGYKEVTVLDDAEHAALYENPTANIYDLLPNQYIILYDKDSNVTDMFRWTGETHVKVDYKSFKSMMFDTVKAKNGDVYQKLAFDSLANNKITMLHGPAGTGKSYIAMAYMFKLLESHKIDKIIVFTNPCATTGAAKLGFYPGTRDEKLLDSQIGNMLGAKLGDKMMLERMLNENKIQLLPFSDIRGFDTTGMNCAVYITEAQNLDIEMMRLALQRIGEDCIAIIDGDYEAQVDMAAYSGSNNGMRRLSEVFRGSDFYGEVKLQNIYRSRIAALAQEM